MIKLYEQGKKVTEICSAFDISRTAFYYWKRWHEKEGIQELKGHKRGPKNPKRTPRAIEKIIVPMKKYL